MDKEQLIKSIAIIMGEEAWQMKRGRAIKTSQNKQLREINRIAKLIGAEKLTFEDVVSMGWG